MNKWTRVNYQPNLPLKESGRVTASKEHIQLSKEAAKEGMVLLKNERQLLPLKAGTRLALFGKGSFDYVKGGGGSGDVTVSYVHNLYDGLKLQDGIQLYEPLCDFYRADVARQYAEGLAPGMTREPELSDALADSARAFADVALIVISRFSGEGWDRSAIECNNEFNPWGDETSMPKLSARIFPDGDFYLTREEKALVAKVKERFSDIVVVLNIGGIIDLTWVKNDPQITAALLGWQGGMEGGLAMAELLVGCGNPSGKLVDTFAADLADYPSTAGFHDSFDYVEYTDNIYVGYRYFETIPGAAERVVYPFGYGLSYTHFSVTLRRMYETDHQICAEVEILNTGHCAGKEVIQLYYQTPGRLLDAPARTLGAFEKTRLLQPGELQVLTLSMDQSELAVYDDLGVIAKSAWVMEEGCYTFYLGTSIRTAEKAEFTLTISAHTVVRQLTAHLVPTSLPKRLKSDGSFEALPTAPCHDMNACAFEKMVPGTEEGRFPATRARESDAFYHVTARQFSEVAEGTLSLDDFMAQLSDDDLIHLLGGQPNTGVANTFGFGNLPEYGVPSIMTADGPAGLRIAPKCGVCTTAWPCATLLACTWNPELVEAIGTAGAEEVKENNLAVWLTPAVNIHRSPLCGRNFEYYSEDPLIAGTMGAAMVRGIQSQHIAASVKHFAVNNKETNRKHSDSRVSERALRMIYLKGFEQIVKESQPWTIMSSYNAINGYRASECHELLEDILRGEWGFTGMVTTDWWTRGEHYKEILAGNDVKMGNGYPERVRHAMELGELGRPELLHCAKRVLELILKID